MAALLLAFAPLPVWLPRAGAQEPANPVYVDDSPIAAQALLGIGPQITTGNLAGAVRDLHKLLTEEGDRVTPSEIDPALSISVRQRVHEVLLAHPPLLEHYRRSMQPAADEALRAGDAARVERDYLLTEAGFTAALTLAQEHLDRGRFDAAALTLRQLERHPDRAGTRGREAAELLASVVAYAPRPELVELARRWGGAPGHQVPWPVSAKRRGLTPLDSLPEITLEGLVSKPLWSVPLTGAATAGAPPEADESGTTLPPFGKELRLFPTVAGETVYVNDGTQLSAWDRFTLSQRWAVIPPPAPDAPPEADPEQAMARRLSMRRRSWPPEDPGTVTVRGGLVAAVTGMPSFGTRLGDPRVHLLDAATGAVRWSILVGALDPQLESGSVRGPVLLEQGLAIVGVRKYNPGRRLVSLYLAGLDLRDGSLRWRRHVGSAGSLPFGRQPVIVDGAVAHRGVIYRGDALGVIGAYEAWTGRPVWVHRFDAQNTQPGQEARAWEVNLPLIENESLVTLAPDRTEVLRLDLGTGRLLARRSTDPFGTPPPQYLLRAADKLVAVGEGRLGVVELENFQEAPVELTPRLPDPGVRGRVTVVGNKLLVPLVSGVALVDLANLQSGARAVALDSPGNVLALESQLLVVDDARLHSYLLWEAARQVLTARMEASPSDAGPAVTFAELAYRADHHEQVLEAIRRARRAIEADPAGNEPERQRLLASVLAMIHAAQEPAEAGPAPAGRISDAALLAGLIETVGALARTTEDRLAHLLARGRFEENAGNHAAAAQVYQAVLDEPELRAATWTGTQATLRGELETRWRLQKLIAAHGPGVAAGSDRAAQEQAARLGEQASVAQLEELARRYPVAAATPEIFRRLALAHAEAGNTAASVAALEAGLRAVRSRGDVNPALVGEIAGRLVRALEERGQPGAAADVLRSVLAAHPGVQLSDGASPLPAEELLARLGAARAEQERWPRVGPVRAEGVQVLAGWSLLKPLIRQRLGGAPRCIVVENGTQVAVFRAGTDGKLEQAWSAPMDGALVDLLRVEGDTVLLFHSTAAGGVVERVDAATGTGVWKSVPFPELFGPREKVRADKSAFEVQTPQDGLGLLSDVVVSVDEQTISLVDRAGRAAALDAQTGAVLWALRTPVARVYDTDLEAGVLVIAGEQDALQNGVPVRSRPTLLVADARTGRTLQRLSPAGTSVRWVRLVGAGSLIVGLDSGLASYDIAGGGPNWVLGEWRLQGSSDAWVFDNRLFVLGADRSMWLLDHATGSAIVPQALPIPPEHLEQYQPLLGWLVEAHPGQPVSERPAAFTTLRGLVLIAPDGRLIGADGLGGTESMLPAQPADDELVTIETGASEHDPDGRMVYNLHQLDTASGKLKSSVPLLLGGRPRRLTLLDGRIVVTAGNTTVALRAPADGGKP
ncbi:MAG TPA: PQQ-binding-like beta-propeller repeat protein [Phycisphaerales bacterium]|nr:PQQ-binding-like beta-propeller repeat protein [Phycisphaerales bacterium]